MGERKRIGIVLFQLGGPDRLESVEPFLYNLFCDPDIIPLGGLGVVLRKPLAWWIARKRAPIAAGHYAAIGGGSPIFELTRRQAAALEEALRPHVDARVVVAMRYWHPLTEEAIGQLERERPEEIVLLPLYPHESLATTGSSLKEWERRLRKRAAARLPVRTIRSFHAHPLYIAAIVERIEQGLARFSRPSEAHLVFSAHGLPMSLAEKGDPYPRQIEETVRLVMEDGGWRNPHTLCFQSRVGRQKWLEPSLTATIERLAGEGARRMLVVPISFVTEHIETLHEIDLEAREEAEKLGVEEFRMMAALDDSPRFIAALADLVLEAVRAKSAEVVSSR